MWVSSQSIRPSSKHFTFFSWFKNSTMLEASHICSKLRSVNTISSTCFDNVSVFLLSFRTGRSQSSSSTNSSSDPSDSELSDVADNEKARGKISNDSFDRNEESISLRASPSSSSLEPESSAT